MKFVRRLLIAACALLSLPAGAAEPPSDPILRIETGRHTAMARRIATDANNRWLVSASDDKTVRVWDLQTGTLLQTMRPPLAGGNEGKLFGLAVSPDGEYIAAAGWRGEWDSNDYVLILQRSSGKLLRRLTGLNATVVELAWSPDGRYLAVGMGVDKGIKVYRTDNYTVVGSDPAYGSNVNGLDFDYRGRLVSTSYDGWVRLYQVGSNGIQQISKVMVPGGKKPYSGRFSPDGTMIAVGFNDAPKVNVLSGNDLAFLFAPDTTGFASDKELSAVSWSVDGQTLYAAGTARVPASAAEYSLRSWSRAGRGAYRDVGVSSDTVLNLRPLANGGIVYSSAEPTWGVLDRNGQRRYVITPAISDFRGFKDKFLLSRDGQTVNFSFSEGGKSPTRFNIVERRYVDTFNESDMVAPITIGFGLDVKNWNNNYGTTLNGKTLDLATYEAARSLAIAPDGQSLVIGADWNLRRFDREGNLLWKKASPGTVWSVNISTDGLFVVAAYGDGTIRWHRLSDGKDIQSFFPHADKKRWVLWTPSGYYDASPGGEDLIGWHLNRSRDSVSDFFPASRFRNQFYRPDVVAKVLNTLDESEAVRVANLDAGRRNDVQPVRIQNVLPPVVEIVTPGDGATVSTANVTVRYNARAPSDAPVTAVRVRVNGQAVTARNLVVGAANSAQDLSIPIPAQDSEIQLFAENKNGVSAPATLRVKWAGARPAAQEQVAFKPKLYVLAVGVSKYANASFNLGLAAKDAGDFARVLQAQQGKLYSSVQVRLLTDGKATKDDVLDGLEWLKREVTARDVGMMFIAGHGINDNQGKYYFLPHNGDPEKLMRTGVPQTDIKETLNSLAGKAVFFVDTCHSGNALGTAKTRGVGTDMNAFVNELASAENGVVVFTAATGKQYSLEDPAWGNGAFTKAVVEGLSGKADYQKNGKITHKGLDYYVAERVKQLTRGAQSPVSIAPAGVTDFPIAVNQN